MTRSLAAVAAGAAAARRATAHVSASGEVEYDREF